MQIQRCSWPGKDELMINYHDNEWGVPLHDDKKLFEFLVLDPEFVTLNNHEFIYRHSR